MNIRRIYGNESFLFLQNCEKTLFFCKIAKRPFEEPFSVAANDVMTKSIFKKTRACSELNGRDNM